MSQFTKDQVVWGKIKGYPWWPGVISKVLPGKDSSGHRSYKVNFLGDFTHADLSEEKLVDFKTGFREHSDNKAKLLPESIKMAQRINNGTSTLEEEINKWTQQKETPSKDVTPAKSDNKSKSVPKTVAKTPQSAKSQKKTKEPESEEPTKPSRTKTSAKEKAEEKEDEKSKKENISKTRSKKKEVVEEEETKKEEKNKKESNVSKTRSKKIEPEEEVEEEKDEGKNKKESVSKARGQKKGVEEQVEEKDEGKSKKEGNSRTRGKKKEVIEEEEEPKVESVSKGKGAKKEAEAKKKEAESEKNALNSNEEKTSPSFKSKVKASLEKTPDGKQSTTRVSPRHKKSAETKEKEWESQKKDQKHKEAEEKMEEEKEKEESAETGDKITKKQQLSKTEEKITSTRSHSPEQEQKKKKDGSVVKQDNGPIEKYEADLTNALTKINEIFRKGKNLTKSAKENTLLGSVMTQLEKTALSVDQIVGSNVGKLLQGIYMVLLENKSHLDAKTQETMSKCGRLVQSMKQQVVQHCFEAKELFKSLNISYNFHSEVLEAASLNIADFENRSKATETADSLKDTDQKILENGANNTSNGEKMVIEETAEKIKKTEETEPPKENDNPLMKELEDIIKLQPADSKANANGKVSAADSKEDGKEDNKEDSAKSNGVKPSGKSETIDFTLRKKFGTKFANFLSTTYKLDKKKNQETTSKVEKKILAAYGDSLESYKEAFKNMVRVLKAKELKLEDLNEIHKMTNEDFVKMLDEALKPLGDGKNGAKGETSKDADFETQDDA